MMPAPPAQPNQALLGAQAHRDQLHFCFWPAFSPTWLGVESEDRSVWLCQRGDTPETEPGSRVRVGSQTVNVIYKPLHTAHITSQKEGRKEIGKINAKYTRAATAAQGGKAGSISSVRRGSQLPGHPDLLGKGQ